MGEHAVLADGEALMPCYDPRDRWASEHNNVAAELLCALLKEIEPTLVPWNPELRQWWEDHQHRDAYYDRKSRETA